MFAGQSAEGQTAKPLPDLERKPIPVAVKPNAQIRLSNPKFGGETFLIDELKACKLSPSKAISWGLKMIISGRRGETQALDRGPQPRKLVATFGVLKILNSAAAATFAYALAQMVGQLSVSGSTTATTAALTVGGLLVSLCSTAWLDGLTNKLVRSIPRQATNLINEINQHKSRATLARRDYSDIVTTLRNELSSGYNLLDGTCSLAASSIILISASVKLASTNPIYLLPFAGVAAAYGLLIVDKLRRDENFKISTAKNTRRASLLNFYQSIPGIVASQRSMGLLGTISSVFNGEVNSTDRRFFANENRTLRRVVAVTALSVFSVSAVGAWAIHRFQVGALNVPQLTSVLSLLGLIGQSLFSCNLSASRVFMSADAMARLEALKRIGTPRKESHKRYQRIDPSSEIVLSFKLPNQAPNEIASTGQNNSTDSPFVTALQKQSIIYLIGPLDSGRGRVMKSLAYANGDIYLSINKIPADQIDPDDYENIVAYLPTERYPINGLSIRGLLFGKDSMLSDEQILNKLKLIGDYIDLDFLKKNEQFDINQINAVIGREFGHDNLFESRREKLMIAAMLLREPRLLLIEDPFKALDNPTRLELEGNLQRWAANHGAKLVITTHQSILKADAPVWVVHNGEIVDCGVHSELKEKHPYYASLFPES